MHGQQNIKNEKMYDSGGRYQCFMPSGSSLKKCNSN